MPDCSSLEAAYLVAEAAEAVAAATWAVEQAEADLAYNDLLDASAAKWTAQMAWWYCMMGGGMRMQAVQAASKEARAAAREMKVQHITRLKAHRDEVVKRFEALKVTK